jgi:hypothetical protein
MLLHNRLEMKTVDFNNLYDIVLKNANLILLWIKIPIKLIWT